MTLREHRWAWAIDPRSGEGHELIGALWHWRSTDSVPYYAPPWQDGCRIALFRTRKDALAFLPRIRRVFPRAVVLRVTITIESRD